jgi:hypothetical protein
MLIVLLKIDLSKEDIPGGEDFIGGLLLLSNTIIPGGALVLAILSFGFDTGALDLLAEKAVEKLEEKEGITVSQQRLVFEGRSMENDKTIADFAGLTAGKCLHMVLSLRGGC